MIGIEPTALIGPEIIIETVIRGFGTAGVYALIASGLTLIFGLMGVLNFAHGSLTTWGAYLGGGLLVTIAPALGGTSGISTIITLLITIVIVFVALSVVGSSIEFSLIRRIYDRPAIDQILLTFGIGITLDELIQIVVGYWDVDPYKPWGDPAPYGPDIVRAGEGFSIGPIDILGLKAFEIVVGALVVAAVWAFLTRTRYGLFIRAGSEDDEMAEALGINVRRVFTLVFGIGIGLAGIAGVFLIWEPLFQLRLSLGAQVLLPAFIVVVVGGLGTYKGTVVASVIAGLFAEFGNMLFVQEVQLGGFNMGDFTALPQILLFILLVVMLIVRPTGLYGQEEVGGH